MPRADGPHTRSGSKKRAARLSPFEELPLNFWLFAAVALLMLGLSMALIYQAL